MTKSAQTKLVNKLVQAHASINPSKQTRGQAFGIIINTMNGEGKTLKEALGEDLGIELTALVLEELGYPKFQKVIVDF